MTNSQYVSETLDNDEDDGTMPDNVRTLADIVVGHRIVSAEPGTQEVQEYGQTSSVSGLVLTLDNGKQVLLANTNDCCAYTTINEFLLSPGSVDHVIMGVGTTGGYSTWHIYADYGDILKLQVGWSCGNPFYYGYGFDIHVTDL